MSPGSKGSVGRLVRLVPGVPQVEVSSPRVSTLHPPVKELR